MTIVPNYTVVYTDSDRVTYESQRFTNPYTEEVFYIEKTMGYLGVSPQSPYYTAYYVYKVGGSAVYVRTLPEVMETLQRLLWTL